MNVVRDFTRRDKCAIAVTAVLLLAVLYGQNSHFLARREFTQFALRLAAAASGLVCVSLAIGLVLGWVSLRAEHDHPYRARMTALLGCLALWPVLTLALWSVLGTAIPDFYARAKGARTTQAVVFRKEVSTAPRAGFCHRKLVSEGFGSVCASKALFDRVPASGITEVLGRTTHFGTHIDALGPPPGKSLEHGFEALERK